MVSPPPLALALRWRAWTAVAMAGAAAQASAAGGATPAVVAEAAPASTREGGNPVDDETSRPVDARDVVSFLLEREHLAAAFELFQDVVESTSASHGAPAERVDDVGRLEEARDALERYFGDRERFPPHDLRAYAEQVDVPLLQASVREQESRARVAEYDAELAAEDLERARVQLEASELERRAAEKRASLGAAGSAAAREAANEAAFVTPPRAFVDPETNANAADESLSQNANDTNVSPDLPPLAAPNASERRALNALVADYLDRRGYRATRLTLRDEADSFSLTKDSAGDANGARVPVPADGLRRAVHRASRLDARDAAHDELRERASAASIRAETLERALAAKEAEAASLAGRVAETEARASETRGEADALARRLEDAARSIAGLETERANATRDFERAAATAKHLEADLEGKTREFKKALAEERRRRVAESTDAETPTTPTTPVTHAYTNETTTDSITMTPITPPSHVFEASAEEEATIRALADALPRVASATLVAERHELLPLFARAATRHKVAASRREMLRSLFDLVKRPERAHRDALAATAFAVARDAGEDRAVRELVPALRLELAHRKQERRLAACACVGSVAKLSYVDLSERARWTVLFPALRDAFVNASDTFSTEHAAEVDASSDASTSGSRLPCPETRDAVLSAFAAVCDGSSAEDAAFAADAAPFLAAALADASERVSERACETAAPAMTRWRVRAGGGAAVAHLESFAKGHAAARAAEALGTRAPSLEERGRGPSHGDAVPSAAHKKSLGLQKKSSPPPPPRDADRWRARFYLRLFARTLETFREEAGNVKESLKNAFDSEVTGWFDANASELARLLVRAIPEEDDDATLRRDAARAVRALCAAAGAGVARERVVPALTREDLEDRYLATATPIALAAALPHCGPGALEAFLREYVARECLKTFRVKRSDGARDDDGVLSAGLFLDSSSLAERAIRRAVSLCDDGDDAAGTVRDAITRVLAAVASQGASAEEDEKTEKTEITADAPADATGPASLATTLLGAAAAACPAASAKHMRVFSEHVFPALSRNAAGPACVAARAAAALVCLGDAHADDADDAEDAEDADDTEIAETGSPFEAGVSAEALRLLDVCLLRRDARVAAAFAAATRAAAGARRRPGATVFGKNVTGGNETRGSRARAFWDGGVASRVAAIATSAFGADDAFALKKKDVATRARLASLCFGAARSLLEAEDDIETIETIETARGIVSSTSISDMDVDVANTKRRKIRDVLVPALRALASANRDDAIREKTFASRGTETRFHKRSLLDASDVALAEAMLRDEDWRLVASAEAAARAVTAVTTETAETRVRKKSYAPSMPVHATFSTAAMRRAMGVSYGKASVVAAAEETRGGDTRGESPASPASVDFATLVGEAAPRHDAGDAVSDGTGDTRDTRDARDEGGVQAAETGVGAKTPTRAATKEKDSEKEDFDPPPTPTLASADAPDDVVVENTVTRLPSQENKEKKSPEKKAKAPTPSVSSKMSSAMFSAMPSAPKMPSLRSVKNPFGK